MGRLAGGLPNGAQNPEPGTINGVPLPQPQPPLTPFTNVWFSEPVTNLHEVSLSGSHFSPLEITTYLLVHVDCDSLAGGAWV